MERKNNIEMNKLFISCLSIFALCNAAYSQTYVYDKNLKVPLQIMVELKIVQASKVYSSSQVIVFNTTRHNTGSHYNVSTGRFTAPVAGKYLFSVNFYTYSLYGVSITLAINGSQYVPSDVTPLIYKAADSVSVSLGFSIILELSASDYVEVRSRAGYASRVYMSHSHFTGQLLS